MKDSTRTFVRLFFPPNPFWALSRLRRFFNDRSAYARMSGRPVPAADLLPMLGDWTENTPIGYYFYQDTWAFQKLVNIRPARHVDIGSTALLVGCMASIVPTISVDIRPLKTVLPGLSYMSGSIVELPFEANSVESISSLCVIEHIGLGRYGDPIDPNGSFKAGKELARVLQTGGNLYISAPIAHKSRVVFNAHRIFSKEEVLSLFPGLKLVEYVLVGNGGILPSLDAAPAGDFPVGLFHFTK